MTTPDTNSQDLTPFTLTASRFDQNTYWGRCRAISEASDPRYAFLTNKQVERYYQIYKNQQAREQAALL
jgi:hypothetical protein